MPCADCGHLLLVSYDTESLYCPNCLEIELEDRDELYEKIERDRELLREDNLVKIIEEYDKGHLLLYLMERLNIISHELFENRRLNLREFSYLNYLIKLIYSANSNRFGDQHLDRGEEVNDEIDALLSSQSELVAALDHLEDEFRLPVKYEVPMPQGRFLFQDYDLRDSEYRYCFHRCLRSLIGGTEEDLDIFDETQNNVRSFTRPELDEVETLEDWANCFHGFIMSMLFVASADQTVGDTYTTFLPDHVSVFDLTEIFDRIDSQFLDKDGNIALEDSTLASTEEDEFNDIGQAVFDEEWEDVQEHIVINSDNTDAHPFLFEINVDEVRYQQQGRPPITREATKFVYPRWYSKLLRFQIFPLLKNGEDDTGHEILKNISTRRGLEFEENLYDYLVDEGFDCYHSAEIPGENSSEIDLLVVNEEADELWFIECKYLMPEILMRTREGIESLNSKFDHKVFNIEAEEYEGSPTGVPFPEKVSTWNELDRGDEFTGEDGENSHTYPGEWTGFESRMMVVSNLIPSYVNKHGVEFRTDMEFIQMLKGDNPVFTPSQEME